MRTRLRFVVALCAALLGTLGLSACQSHVGAAGFVGGYRISETAVNKYLTPQAKPYTTATSTGTETIVPKTYVLQLLIQQRIFDRALTRYGGAPTTAELTKAHDSLLASTTDAKVTAEFASHGFTSSFEPMLVKTFELNQVLTSRYTTSTAKKNVVAYITSLSRSVKTSPRYGAWNGANFQLGSTPSPSFLKLNAATTTS